MASSHSSEQLIQVQEIHNIPQPNANLPLVVVHCLPKLKQIFTPSWFTQFRLVEPPDPLAQSARVLICVGTTPVSSETLDEYPSVELVVGSMAGLDHIDLVECRRRGVKVSSAGHAFSDDVADHAVALLIDVLRRVSAADRYVRAKLWPAQGNYPLGSKMGEKQVGIVGLGSIGIRVARRLEAFGCNIAYNSRKKKTNVAYRYYTNVHDLATNCDVLVLCCALTNETHHMVNKDVMKALGKQGIIINVGRGSLIDEEELVLSLLQGDIGGAGLDVYEKEPNVPKELFSVDNVVLSPHHAGATPESSDTLREVIIGNLEAFFHNKPLVSEVEIE